ncbi:unnamed protein product [Linum tenue]|uniref:non-specific serine/threonine protein kinase n=1 Tax=Linum tenue TaxID=586396 RepID=A0AAV0JXL9_9ROSI|nr:unnamed protein product [Linum tenue]
MATPISLVFKFTLILTLNLFFTRQPHEVSCNNDDTDRIALLQIKNCTTNDPDGFFSSWNDSLHFCSWPGVQCSLHGSDERVTSLDLSELNLVGTLPPHVGNLSFLRFINIENNTFHGRIPPQLGNLVLLQHFNATGNSFTGTIPANLSRCSKLRILMLSSNKLRGKIPVQLGSLSKLEILRIGQNNLTGPLPASLGNLSQLVNFGAAYNNLVGRIPESFGRLSKLNIIAAGINQLSGTIPMSLYNLSTIHIMTFTFNKLEGRLPENIGFTLRDIGYFAVSENDLVGSIPESLCNASRLVDINMNMNRFAGRIPNCLGNSGGLLALEIGGNNLGYNSMGDFDFLTSLSNCSQLDSIGVSMNNLGGELPGSVGNLSSTRLTRLSFALNRISGVLPEGLQKLVGLTDLELQSNIFQGQLPSSLGKLQNLQLLSLQGNELSGRIPDSIGGLKRLFDLDLSQNRLEGPIPASLGNCLSLTSIDISHNKLSGEIPAEVMNISSSLAKLLNLSHNSLSGKLPRETGKLTHLNTMDVSHNNLSGEIPSTIENCESMERLFVQGNSFQGSIPSSLASIKGLRELDLSCNSLTGEIPQQLQDVRDFQYLNLSYNDLRGEVPSGGIFRNTTAVSLIGNPLLCATMDLHLPKCATRPASSSHHSVTRRVRLAIIAVSASLFLLLLSSASLLLYMNNNRCKKQQSVEDPGIDQFARVSYYDLHEATNGFSPDNVLGSGGFGTVYKGKLDRIEAPVAVKVLNLRRDRANKSLAAECNALRSIRHRNLVKVVSFCSSVDRGGNDFKALVFEYMENGSLEDWLHHETRRLTLAQRLDIAVDVGSALHYLHDHCETPIVHCDLKPSNVLLDADMVGRVSDFGQARLVSSDHDTFSRRSSTSGAKGTIGYAAPEYGMGSAASKRGDVYSFGILILEMFTGKRPTDEMFGDGVNLRDYVKAGRDGEIGLVGDPDLFRAIDGEEEGRRRERKGRVYGRLRMEKMQSCLVSVLEVGMACSAETPGERMNMVDATRRLKCVRDMVVSG